MAAMSLVHYVSTQLHARTMDAATFRLCGELVNPSEASILYPGCGSGYDMLSSLSLGGFSHARGMETSQAQRALWEILSSNEPLPLHGDLMYSLYGRALRRVADEISLMQAGFHADDLFLSHRSRVEDADILNMDTTFLATSPQFDGLIGNFVFHMLVGPAGGVSPALDALAARLKPGAPVVLTIAHHPLDEDRARPGLAPIHKTDQFRDFVKCLGDKFAGRGLTIGAPPRVCERDLLSGSDRMSLNDVGHNWFCTGVPIRSVLRTLGVYMGMSAPEARSENLDMVVVDVLNALDIIYQDYDDTPAAVGVGTYVFRTR